MSHSTKIFVKDFIPSLPYPPLFQIDKEDLVDHINNRLKVNYRVVENTTFVNYPELFGKEFEKVWFSSNIIGELTNHHLMCLEYFFNSDTDEARNVLDFFPNSDILVYSLDFPLSSHPVGTVIGIK